MTPQNVSVNENIPLEFWQKNTNHIDANTVKI